jgi:thiol-disulfide isomerase/thioredoxin
MRHHTTLALVALLVLVHAGQADTSPPPIPYAEVLNGKPEELAWDKLKGRVVMVDFFSKDCKPCIKAMPMLVKLQEKYKDRLQIVGYHIGRGTPDEVAAVIAKLKLNWPIVMAPGWENPKVDIPGNDYLASLGSEMLPAAALFDAEGKLQHKDLRPDDAHAKVVEMLEKMKRPSSPGKGRKGRSRKN